MQKIINGRSSISSSDSSLTPVQPEPELEPEPEPELELTLGPSPTDFVQVTTEDIKPIENERKEAAEEKDKIFHLRSHGCEKILPKKKSDRSETEEAAKSGLEIHPDGFIRNPAGIHRDTFPTPY